MYADKFVEARKQALCKKKINTGNARNFISVKSKGMKSRKKLHYIRIQIQSNSAIKIILNEYTLKH